MKTNNSTLKTNVITQQKYARLAGSALFIMALTAIFAFAVVFNRLVVQNDAVVTYNNISSAFGMFNAGIGAWFVILLMDLLVTWALFYYYKPVHRTLSLMSSGFRLTYTFFLGIAIVYLLLASKLVSDSLENTLLNTTTLQNEVLQRVMTFEALWSFGLIVFGFHLLALGLLTFKSRTVPKWICILLLIAGFGYLFIHGMNTFLPSYETLIASIESILSLPMALAELSFAVWLLIYGGQPFLNAAE